MKIPIFLTPLLLCLFISLVQGQTSKCDIQDHGSTLKVFHIFSQCSPFKPSKPMSWEESVLQLQAKDQARMQYLTSLVARKSVVPIASARQIIQSPTYIVKGKIGTPPQTLLLALDTSNDVAWIPCTGCVGCSTSKPFAPIKSTSFKNVGCGSSQCKQVSN
ncbi:protein ASPARTIC PROTEASE IN GUARD CELL 2-like [Trifolium pratense]|uniref:Protein ASPARTIC PROTEASE IN GUARD CELL 2-like n=1 Tax=Trifolium pratense TaxID=57577 RepID=A0A2K3LQE8_TRIPR|nr:protein ASPARTIC PROTEASE IN GUARD CELL 2-like [Trifolium pratense]